MLCCDRQLLVTSLGAEAPTEPSPAMGLTRTVLRNIAIRLPTANVSETGATWARIEGAGGGVGAHFKTRSGTHGEVDPIPEQLPLSDDRR